MIRDTGADVLFVMFVCFYLSLSAVATCLSTVARSNLVGFGIGFFVSVVMWMCTAIINFVFYTTNVPKWVRDLCSLLLPPFVWAKSYDSLKRAAGRNAPIQWDMIGDNGFICPEFCSASCQCDYFTDTDVSRPPEVILPIAEAMRWLLLSVVLYGTLAIYLDQVIPSGYGRAQPWYYLVLPSYWCPSTIKASASDTSTKVVDDESTMDEDVLAEMRRVLSGGADADAVRVVNLAKTYGHLCKPAFTAVFRVNVGIKHETLFCLLGHNGAGKTTTFNMLSGMFAPTQGDAFVFGYSVKKQLRSVQTLMGICPQHDILWPELSGTEHLKLFAGLANTPRAEITQRVETFLKRVDLTEFANRACSKYSGGMRRRLSVACSLIADPKVVYLDEPTTGMDPVNRRGVWDVIEQAKKGRVVVLTTHAMEEADTLGDTISIMSRGRLHCLGTALHLKNKYGTGYTVDIKVPMEKQDEVLASLKTGLLPNAAPVGATEISGTVKLEEVTKMAPLCAHIENSATGADMTVSMCTLETVFISIAEAAADPEHQRLQRAQGAVPQPQQTLPAAPAPTPAIELLDGARPAGANAMTYSGNISPSSPVREIRIPRAAGQKLGLDLEDKKGKVLVKVVHPGYAAATSGLIAVKDVITHIGGEPVAGKKKDGVYRMIGAIQGDEIVMTIDASARASRGGPSSPPASPPPSPPNATSSTAPPGHFDMADPHGVLEGFLPFKKTPFRTQFRAVSRKNFTFQIRQPCLNCCCCFFMPAFFLALYIALQMVVPIIIGAPIIQCGSARTDPSEIDNVLPNPNTNTIDNAISQLRLSASIGRTDCPTSREVNELARLDGWTYAQCSNLPIAQLTTNQQAEFGRLRTQFGCNETLYDHIYPLYQYQRDARSAADQCEPPLPNVTFDVGMGATTRGMGCYEAFGVWSSTCTVRPTRCPRTTLTNDDDADDLTEVDQILALKARYGCSANVGEMLRDYSSTSVEQGGVTVRLPANVSKSHVATCMSENYMCLTPSCRAVPAYLDTSYPHCTNDTAASALEVGAWLASHNYNPAAAGYAAYECQTSAANFCSRDTAFRECPALTQELRVTDIPFSVEMTPAEVAALGEVRHSATALASCTDCFRELLENSPTVARGALTNFTLRQNMGRDEQAMSMITVNCATGDGSDDCTASRADLDQLLWDAWYQLNSSSGRYTGAYHFSHFDHANRVYEYTALYNGTIRGGYEEGNEPEIAALLHRVSSTIYKTLKGVELNVRAMGYPSFDHHFDLDITLFLAFVFPVVLGFLQVMITYQIVAEKATNMRELMVMSGLGRQPYWIITWLYGVLVYSAEIVLFLTIAYSNNFKAVGGHDPIVILLLLVVFAMQTVSYSCFVSTWFNNKWAALVFCFFSLVFIFILFALQFSERAMGYRTNNSAIQFLVNLHPTIALCHASELIHNAGVGNIEQLSKVRFGFHNIGFDGPHPVAIIILAMFLGSIFWMILAVYLDIVLPIGPGLKSSPWFIFQSKTYVTTKKLNSAKESAKNAESSEAAEVVAERERVVGQTDGVRALGLSKVYPGAKRAAVVNVQFGINESECFGLLGSNGAGKSTTIHMLCGLHPPTTGTVICGEENLDIRDSLSTMQSAMGVCSQDNLLWGDLTGPEHLRFFSRLRKIESGKMKHHINYWLRRVNLDKRYDRLKYSRSYSGGMKRRLGVANAFIGNPKLVYLDEPSTGLDPESRQQLWRAVLAAKPHKAIILTTHALEEAEALCDRVGIMTFGLMRTLGTPTELRLRFDQGYKFMLACESGRPEDEEKAHAYVLTLMPQARLVDSINGVRTYIVPKGAVKMSALFEGMEANKAEYRIKDWGLSHTSLEEVFLQIVAASSLNR